MNERHSKVLDYLNGTLSTASGYHTDALGKAQDSRDAYEGALYGNERKGRSTIVVKDIMRTVQGALPSVVEPFISDEIVQIDAENPEDSDGAKKQEALINYQWSKRNRPLDVMETVGINLMVDGTAWVMTGWHRGGYPTVEAVPFESVIPDPAATSLDECRFIIYRRKVTVGEIMGNPEWYGKHSKETLAILLPNSNTLYDPAPTRGREDTYDPEDRSLEKIEIFEYYGYYDLNNDDEPEPVLMIWSDNLLLRATESPFTFGPIPFDNAVYSKIPFSIYGATMEELIGDHQRLRTGITRGIIDNMMNSNNGTKFVRKGSLDATNFRRLMNNDPLVELNAPSQLSADALIYDGNFNQLPPDVYKMLEDTQKEEENLSGITRYAIGSDSRSLNQTATGIGIISSMSQRRLIYITRHISDMMESVFAKWASLNANLIDNVVIPTSMGYAEVSGAELPENSMGIKITTPTEGLKEKRMAELASMVQAVAPMVGQTGPEIVLGLLSEMASTMDMPRLQRQLMESMNKPNPAQNMQQMAAQIEAQKAQVDMMKQSASAQKDIASAQKYTAEADKARYQVLKDSFGGETNL
jgi:hypothetical protein